MAVSRKYVGEDGRHYPFLPLADGTAGWVASPGTVEIATAEAVPTDGRFEQVRTAKKTVTKKAEPEPDAPADVAAAADTEGEQA